LLRSISPCLHTSSKERQKTKLWALYCNLQNSRWRGVENKRLKVDVGQGLYASLTNLRVGPPHLGANVIVTSNQHIFTTY
jgi:hypothetical protein